MNEIEFRAQLRAGGFPEPMPVERAPEVLNDTHVHDFTASVLVLDGEYTVTSDGGSVTYRPGDAYTLRAGTAHAEVAGAAGARLLIARK